MPTSSPDSASFLAELAAAPDAPVDARLVLVVAHPDDETLGCGGQLPRFKHLRIVHVTDGAPRDGADAAAHGCPDWQGYAALRQAELLAALALAGIGADALTSLGVPDQQTALRLAEIAARLRPLLAAADIVLTHAFEGGHPDHDATALAVHAACAALGRTGAAPAIVEMPFYRAGPAGWLCQCFVPDPAAPETTLTLTEPQRRLKRAMLAAFPSQADILAGFATEVERFRPAPRHDFLRRPAGGLLYERHAWGMDWPRWTALAEQFGAPC
jgi:LmbE family N-acetylglucosaminyl deacetylase